MREDEASDCYRLRREREATQLAELDVVEEEEGDVCEAGLGDEQEVEEGLEGVYGGGCVIASVSKCTFSLLVMITCLFESQHTWPTPGSQRIRLWLPISNLDVGKNSTLPKLQSPLYHSTIPADH